MKKLDVNLKVLMAIIILFGLSLSLMAQPRQKDPRHQNRGDRGFAMLKLSDEQKEQAKTIHLANAKEVQPLKDELAINKAKINALIKQDDPDMKEIVSLVEANGKLLTDIQVKSIESKIRFRSILNEEQKVIFDANHGRMQRKKAMAMHRRAYMQKQGRSR
jgi:Spy/CpxP family protein refolding chaperone